LTFSTVLSHLSFQAPLYRHYVALDSLHLIQ
jgi:hypothetical protein